MSQDRVYSIIGDSNVKRHMSRHNCRDRPWMSSAQIIPCNRLALFSTALSSVRQESNVCIVSCITNFITARIGSSTLTLKIEPALTGFLERLATGCGASPDVQFLVCPPMYRMTPVWYRDGLPEILQRFSTVMKDRPSNCLLLPSFPTPSFEEDGIHLTAYSGSEFVLHLFDSAKAILSKAQLSVDSKQEAADESARVLEDRVMVLEQDHRRLNAKVELKAAVDAELFDFEENARCEDFIMIQVFIQCSAAIWFLRLV